MKRRIRNQTPYQTRKRANNSYSRNNSPSPSYTRRTPKTTRTNIRSPSPSYTRRTPTFARVNSRSPSFSYQRKTFSSARGHGHSPSHSQYRLKKHTNRDIPKKKIILGSSILIFSILGIFGGISLYNLAAINDIGIPTISITYPSSGSTLSDTIDVQVSASDNFGVSKVGFFIDNSLQMTDSIAPFTYRWDTSSYTNEGHSITAIAYDIAGNKASDTNTITISNAPSPTLPTRDIYMSYNEYTAYLQDISTKFPQITEIFSANDHYGVASSTVGGREVWTIEVTDESFIGPKADILLVGTHHGNEKISFETSLYAMEQLITGWIEKDEYITHLLKTRKIVIVPMMNPDGYNSNNRYNANGKDLNRNYDIDQSSSISFSEVESKCIRDIVTSHEFMTAISWHSGIHTILYSGPDPDAAIFSDMANLMSDEAGTYQQGYYDWGTFSVNGGFACWAYSAENEPQNTNYGPYDNANVLSFCAEVSSTKTPPSSQVPGWSAKNWELAKVCIDLGMPYTRFTEIPTNVEAGSQFNVKWLAGGCFDADATQVAFSDDHCGVTAPNPTGKKWHGVTSQQSGKSFWYNSNGYSSIIQAPSTPGTYFLAIRLQADSAYYSTSTYSSWAESRHNKVYFSMVHSFTVYSNRLKTLNIKNFQKLGDFINKGGTNDHFFVHEYSINSLRNQDGINHRFLKSMEKSLFKRRIVDFLPRSYRNQDLLLNIISGDQHNYHISKIDFITFMIKWIS